MAELGYKDARPKLKDEAVPDIALILPAADKKQGVKRHIESDLNSSRSAYNQRTEQRQVMKVYFFYLFIYLFCILLFHITMYEMFSLCSCSQVRNFKSALQCTSLFIIILSF